MDYIDNLKNDVKLLPNGMVFNAKIKFMERIIDALAKNTLPKYHFPQLQLSEKDITKYMSSLVNLDPAEFSQMSTDLEKFDHDLGEFRTYLQNRFGYWATITQDFIEQLTIAFPNQTFLELMAGNGYISKGLEDLGVESICTDDLSWASHDETGNKRLTTVESLDALTALDKYGQKVDNVILAWSPDREIVDYEILQKVRQLSVNFLVIGEKYGATNSKEFWDNAKLVDDSRVEQVNRVYSHYDLVHDQLYLVQ